MEREAADVDLLIAVTQSTKRTYRRQLIHSMRRPNGGVRIVIQAYLAIFLPKAPIDAHLSNWNSGAIFAIGCAGAFDTIPMAEGRVRVIGVRCNEDVRYQHAAATVDRRFPDLHIVVVGIIRDGKAFVPSADEQMLAGDDVYFIADNEHVPRAMAVFGHEERQARRIIIAGGGNAGVFLAQLIRDEHPGVYARIIESNREGAERAARRLPDTTVINGNALTPRFWRKRALPSLRRSRRYQ